MSCELTDPLWCNALAFVVNEPVILWLVLMSVWCLLSLIPRNGS